MDWIDQKYINLVSGNLPLFKKKNGVYNFRCPICGDSKKSLHKARGFLVEQNQNVFYKCHNCGISKPFAKFLEFCNAQLFQEYRNEKYIEKNGTTRGTILVNKLPDITSTAKPIFLKESPLKHLKKVSQLRSEHPVKLYVAKRKIPSNMHFKLFYAPKFKEWVNSFIPEKFDLNQPDEPRLVIPLLDSYGNFVGLQGRNFSKKGLRYITIIVDETKPKLYGLDHTDLTKPTYLLEGPIDSMFIPNSLAMVGSDCFSAIDLLKKQNANVDFNFTFVYDNEPRNKEIVGRIEKAIEKGYKVALWPSHIEQKDVNEMVLAGMKPADIKIIIDVNTFSGIEAKLKLSMWRKV
jgi:predicted RNA-binding Zn-ribbon protein involved in translation (DUF1610 family)